jgi:hypothetical protein
VPANPADASGTTKQTDQTESKQTTARPAIVARSAVPYYVAAVFALATMAWYVFIFVPSKVEYFVGLKLRALAVAANQVETRAENLATAFRTAPQTPAKDKDSDSDTAKYLRALVPDIKLLRNDEPTPAGLQLRRPPAAAKPQEPKQAAPAPPVASVAWERLMAQAAAVSAAEFDDLMVALPTGEVIWQREPTTPRVGNLSQILETLPADRGWFSLKWTPKPEVPKGDAKALATAVTVKPIELGGEATLLLVQTIALPADSIDIEGMPPPVPVDPKATTGQATAPRRHRLHIAATVPLATLQAQAMNIPIVWIVALSLPVILLFLALPAVKLATLTTRERFGFADVVMLLVATIMIAGLGAAMPLTQTAVDDAGDDMLAQFSTSLQKRLVEDVTEVQAIAAAVTSWTGSIQSGLKPCEAEIAQFPGSRCNFWAALDAAQKAEAEKKPEAEKTSLQAARVGGIELDIVAWLDEAGNQVDKWTTKAQVTGPTPHDRFQHYRDLALDRLWTLKPDSSSVSGTGKQPPPSTSGRDMRFTIEPLRAPTTADLAVIVGFRLDSPRATEAPTKDEATTREAAKQEEAKQGTAKQEAGANQGTQEAPRKLADRSKAKYLVLNVRPGSLFDAVVPPGFGFAVIAQDGRVLFHSQENLSLGENFFEEVGESARVRARAQSVRKATWTGDYHGRPHRIHIERPVAIEGCPWRVVTFRELTPVYGGVFTHQSGTFRLSLLNVLFLFLFAAVVWIRARVRRRDVRDLLNVRSMAEPLWVRLEVGLTALAVIVVILTYVPWTGSLLNWIYVFFVAVPFMALWIASRARKTVPFAGDPGRPIPWIWLERALLWIAAGGRKITHPTDKSSTRLVCTELTLMVLLVAALPAIAFSRIAERVQVSRASERLLEETQRAIAIRNARVQARVTGPAYPSPASFDVRAHLKIGFAQATDVAKYSYLSFLPMQVIAPPPPGAVNPDAGEGQELVRFLLDWNPLPSRDVAGEPAMVVDSGSFRLNSPLKGLPALAVRDASVGVPPFLAGLTDFSAPWAKGLAGVLLVAAAIAGLYWARQRLLAQHTHQDVPSLSDVLKCLPPGGKHGVMLIGAPRAKKDGVLSQALRKRHSKVALRKRLLDSDAKPKEVEADLQALVKRPGWLWQSLGGRSSDVPGMVWINVSNLETHLVDPGHRKLALELLEQLLTRGPADLSRVVVVTTNVDPVAHFEEIFEEERKGIYEDAVPEIEHSRFAVLLTRFHRCYVPFHTNVSRESLARFQRRYHAAGPDPSTVDPWWNYTPAHWRKVLDWETRSLALRHVRRELHSRWDKRTPVSIDELSNAIASRAAALYQLL